MQVVIFETLGISELQRRIASPVHICCASALKAKLEVDGAQKEAAKANVKPVWRIILMLSLVMVGSLYPPRMRPGVDAWIMPERERADCDAPHSA
jgi:hypothetical protein